MSNIWAFDCAQEHWPGIKTENGYFIMGFTYLTDFYHLFQPLTGTLLGNGLGYKIRSWEPSKSAHSFLYNVELSNGELIIPETGFYYIYAQTYFRFREPENPEFDSNPGSDSVLNPKQMVQYISKYTNYPDPILLMKSARTSCWSKKAGYGLYSIYQGGVFQLKSQDRIFVSISHEDLVDLDKEASFFGAFLIS